MHNLLLTLHSIIFPDLAPTIKAWPDRLSYLFPEDRFCHPMSKQTVSLVCVRWLIAVFNHSSWLIFFSTLVSLTSSSKASCVARLPQALRYLPIRASILLKGLFPKLAQFGTSKNDRNSERSVPPPPIARVARTALTLISYQELFQRPVGCWFQSCPRKPLYLGAMWFSQPQSWHLVMISVARPRWVQCDEISSYCNDN